MALSKEELKELIGLHDVISHWQCFNVRDLARESSLLNKATARQLHKICKCCYVEVP